MKIRYIYGEKIGDRAIKAITVNGKLSLYATLHDINNNTHIKKDSFGNASLYKFCGSGYEFVKHIKGNGLKPIEYEGEVKDVYISLDDYLNNDFYLTLNL